MKIFVTDLSGKRNQLEAVEGWRIMEIIREHNLPIKAECGGACACATCHVYIHPEWVSKLHTMSEDEEYMLDVAFDLKENSRLSCQIIMNESLDGLELTMAPNPD